MRNPHDRVSGKDRACLPGRGLVRFEVLGCDVGRDHIRSLTRRLAQVSI